MNLKYRLQKTKSFISKNIIVTMVIIFEILILTCAIMLNFLRYGDILLEVITISAYLFLIVGFILQAINFLSKKGISRERRDN
jgi:hypothetical protein